jgi:hypothetical protein
MEAHMHHATAVPAVDYRDHPATLPVPMSPACTRSLLNHAAREHVRAEAARKAARATRHTTRQRGNTPRCDRLTRVALRADARAADLVAEVR